VRGHKLNKMSEGKREELKQKPEGVQTMLLFEYLERIGTLQDIGLGKLNQSGWLITNEDGTESWISEKQYNKITDLKAWRRQ